MQLQGAYSARVTAELPFWLGSWGVVSGRWYSDKASQIERLIVKDERKQTIFDSVALCDDSKVMVRASIRLQSAAAQFGI